MTQTVQAPGGVQYDAAGNVTNDGKNQYLYNADGQICAVQWTYNSLTVMTGYIYDADGNRVAKGTITTMSCDPSVNGFTTQSDYVRDQVGNQVTELDADSNGNITGQHTNVWANGQLIGTYDRNGTHFYLNDWLGTRRVQTDYAGVVEQTCSSLPFGDSETCIPLPTENLFTGKERDSESGNDYFGARYYASSMGRWLSPDWSAKEEPVPYAKLGNPQSLDLYDYVLDNPLSRIDSDGHGCGSYPGICRAIRDAVSSGGSIQDGWNAFMAQQQINTAPPPPPLPPPAAILHTSIKGGYTEFEWTDKNDGFHDDKIRSLVKADHRSKPGAGGPFESNVVGQIKGLSSPAYGPEGAQINTGDSRGRWIHGGGSSLGRHAYDPNQRLTPTFGCTRACNVDVQRMGGEIMDFQNANPGTPIPYLRTEQ